MSRALVTGRYGLIGSALVRVLVDRDVEVTVLRRDATPRSELVLDGLEERAHVVADDVPDGTLIERTLLDPTKLRELTGWAPQVDLKEGLRRTVEGYRAHPTALGR